MSMERIPVWIDTDCGVDDAFAILCALKLPQLDVKGLSAVAGNAEEEHTFENTRNVLSLAGREDVKVYPGAKVPLIRPLITAVKVHGVDGLNGAKIPASRAAAETEPAWDALYDCALANEGKLELILLGPETNAAIAFRKHPDLKEHLHRILIMGGAAIGGNFTPSAEFNILVDPQAAEIVFQTGMDIVMCGLDVTNQSTISRSQIEELSAHDSDVCRFFRNSTGNYIAYEGVDGYVNHDANPIFYAAMPQLFTGGKAGVHVETRGPLTMGKTVTDLYTDKKFDVRNVLVVTGIDRKAFTEEFVRILEEY